MITEENVKEILESMSHMLEIMEEYKIFREEHPDEDCSEKETEIAEMIYSLAEKVPHAPIDFSEFPETFNYEDENTDCIEE